jgi:splicing factor 3B subunit 3
VPGEPDGPGGIIVVCENFIVYKKVDHEDRECGIPKRNDNIQGKGVFMTCHSVHIQKDLFFFLMVSEYGDLYKINMQHTGAEVHGIQMQYFDTIQPCNEINILKTGFLFAASEYSNHAMYQFRSIGDDEEAPI